MKENTPNKQRKQKTWWAETRHETKRNSACASFLLYCGIQAAAARHMHQYCDYQSERGEGEFIIAIY